jgi:ABC-type antimicrobial peptide transport system permease subunit
MFSDLDVRNGSKVCVLGQTLVRELFNDQPPVGREVRINNVSFRVLGVLSAKGANMMGRDQDDIILAPWTTIKYRVTGSPLTDVNQSSPGSAASSEVNTLSKLYPNEKLVLYPEPSAAQAANTPLPVRFTNIDTILVSVMSEADIPLAIQQITRLLRERHRMQPGQPDDFNIRDMTEMTRTLASTSLLMTNLLLSVALISLVVGGVGIMNIMLVSVTERTREIGLRMAVGGRGRDILIQFLVEAVALCLAGGAVGILAGCTGSYLVTLILRWPTETSLTAIFVSVMVSASVGIIFGFYPAWKASRLDPIEALRYE